MSFSQVPSGFLTNWTAKTIFYIENQKKLFKSNYVQNELGKKEALFLNQFDSSGTRYQSMLLLEKIGMGRKVDYVIEEYFFGEEIIFKLHIHTNQDSLFTYRYVGQFNLEKKKAIKLDSLVSKKSKICDTISDNHFFVVTSFLHDIIEVNGLYFSCSNSYRSLYRMLVTD